MNDKIHELLYYYNDEGYEGYDLSEVQLIEEIDFNRAEELKLLLHNENKYISYQTMLILLAWSIQEGFELLELFITEKWDEKENFEPHRIYNEDNVYDIIINALYIATLNGKNEQELYPFIKEFLNLYGEKFFESNLKIFLLEKNCRPLLKEIEQAMQKALNNKRYYQASQLFPVTVHYDKDTFNKYVNIFTSFVSYDNRIAYNIEEAQKIADRFTI